MNLLSFAIIFLVADILVSGETISESLLQCQLDRIIFSIGCRYCSPQDDGIVMDSFYKLKTNPVDLLHPDNFTNFMITFCPKYLVEGYCANFTSDLMDDCEYDTEMEEHLNDLTFSLALAEYFCNWDKNILIDNAESEKPVCMARIFNFNTCMKQIKIIQQKEVDESNDHSEGNLCFIANQLVNCMNDFGECQNHEVEAHLDEAVSKLKMQLSCDKF